MRNGLHIGEQVFATADINLATALLSVGFAFVEGNECHIVASDNGGVYGRFQFYPFSEDGKHEASNCNAIFNKGEGRDAEFSALCEFISNRPCAKMSVRDWLDYAFEAAKNAGAKLPKFDFPSVADYVSKNPNDITSLFFAYACNRQVCIDTYKTAKRYHLTNQGSGAAMINAKAPKYFQKELLGRL